MVVTFKEFCVKKGKERVANFRPNSKGKRKRNHENLQDNVTVNVGIMLFDGSELKKQRGQRIGVSVKKATTTKELLNACLAKQKAHAKHVINEGIDCCILYSDGTKVDKLKETDEDFVLHKYKVECGKPYNRISFFLCPELDFTQADLANCLMNADGYSSSCSGFSDPDSQATLTKMANDPYRYLAANFRLKLYSFKCLFNVDQDISIPWYLVRKLNIVSYSNPL